MGVYLDTVRPINQGRFQKSNFDVLTISMTFTIVVGKLYSYIAKLSINFDFSRKFAIIF